jgi:membrane protein DedA with SNARE-associated domain
MMQFAPIAAALGLFAATFVQEGVALAGGAAIIINGTLSPPFVALSLFCGMVAGDCSIYGLGRLARGRAWARRWIEGIELSTAGTWLNKNLLLVVPAAHLVPTVLFPTLVTLGWFKVPFARFATASLAFNALYVPLALFLLTYAGRTAVLYMAENPWHILLTGAVLVTALLGFGFRRANAPA